MMVVLDCVELALEFLVTGLGFGVKLMFVGVMLVIYVG